MAVATTLPAGSTLWTKPFWKGAVERAIKTFAQAFLAVFGVGTAVEVTGSTLNAETWYLAAISGAAAAVLSLVMSLANTDFVAGTTASVSAPAAVGLVAPAPEAIAIPDGDGEHRAAPAGSTAVPVIHEN